MISKEKTKTKEKDKSKLVIIRDKNGIIRGYSAYNLELNFDDSLILNKNLTDEEIKTLQKTSKLDKKETSESLSEINFSEDSQN